MPWCDTCAKYLTPPTVSPNGTCPTCGQMIQPVAGSSPATTRRGPWRRLPWHVKVLLLVFAVYLAFRIGQGIEWLFGEF